MRQPDPWDVIEVLGNKLQYATSDYDMIPELVIQLVDGNMWQSFVTPRGETVKYESFERFVETPPLAGLGASVESLKRACADDTKALDRLDEAMQRPPSLHAVDNINGRPDGTSESAALRRLRKEAETSPEVAELREQVLAGQLTAHAAMVKAGFRPRTFTVRADPESAARTLKKQLTQEQVAQLKELL